MKINIQIYFLIRIQLSVNGNVSLLFTTDHRFLSMIAMYIILSTSFIQFETAL